MAEHQSEWPSEGGMAVRAVGSLALFQGRSRDCSVQALGSAQCVLSVVGGLEDVERPAHLECPVDDGSLAHLDRSSIASSGSINVSAPRDPEAPLATAA